MELVQAAVEVRQDDPPVNRRTAYGLHGGGQGQYTLRSSTGDATQL